MIVPQHLSYSPTGFSIIFKRDIDEIMVNSFNPEWTLAWNGNTDVQLTLDFFAVITYITEYFTKSDSSTMKNFMNALKDIEYTGVKQKMSLLMNTWLTHRQMGIAEAVYKLFEDFHFRKSSLPCQFIQACRREERSKYLMSVDGKSEYNNVPKIHVENRQGEYIEKYDIIDKYSRRSTFNENTYSFKEAVKYICLAQLHRLKNISLNKNPTIWETSIKQKLNIFILNIGGINSKFQYFKHDPMLQYADIIFLSETWMNPGDDGSRFHLENFTLHLNSVGFGKGLATYVKKDLSFNGPFNFTSKNLQISKIQIRGMDLNHIYRSKNDCQFEKTLRNLSKPLISRVIFGDFNQCYIDHKDHAIFQELRNIDYHRISNSATHIEGGHIDQIWHRLCAENIKVVHQKYSPYYVIKDHDAYLMTIIEE